MPSAFERVSLILSPRFIVNFFLFYAVSIYGVGLIYNASFLTSSFIEGEYRTLLSTLGAIAYNPLPVEHWLLIGFILALLSFNLLLFIYYFGRLKSVAPATIGFGGAGVLIVSLGVACFSCGAILLTIIASFAGAGALPYLIQASGVYAVWAGSVLLLCLTLYLFKKVTDPFVC